MSGTLLLTKCLPWRIKCVVTHFSRTFLNFVESRIVLLGAGVIHVKWSVSTAHKVGAIICDAKVDISSTWNVQTHCTFSEYFLKITNCQSKHVAKQWQRSKHNFAAVIIYSFVSYLHPKPIGVSHIYDFNFSYAVEYIFHIHLYILSLHNIPHKFPTHNSPYRPTSITEQQKPTRCYLLFYCTSYRLNMFRALLCLSSGARDYDVDYHIGRFVLGLL